MFVSVEGIECSGKSSVVRDVASRLRADGWAVDLFRDFAATHSRAPVEDAVRKSIFFSLGFTEGRRAALLYMLHHEAVKWDRAEPLSRDVLIADRFVDSVAVYQGHFLPPEGTSDPVLLERRITGLMEAVGVRMPSRTYLLDIPPQLAARRFLVREGRSLTTAEFGHIAQIRESFLTLARSTDRIRLVDGSGPRDEIVEQVLDDLRTGLPGHRPALANAGGRELTAKQAARP